MSLLGLRRSEVGRVSWLFAVAFFLKAFFGDKAQGRGIDAITQACWWRSIVEDVSEVRISFFATHFGAPAEDAIILFFHNIFGL